ncbi:MAG: hypothetical protein ACI8WB_006012 [Phenylobacterium sp.]|jgi:hypothetical protein
MKTHPLKCNISAALAMLVLFSLPTCAQPAIEPMHVLQYAQKLSVQINQLAQAMGIKPHHQDTLEVSSVSPKTVYYQAATLYHKSQRLRYEFSNISGAPINSFKADAQPADVLFLLNQVAENLNHVGTRLHLSPPVQSQPLKADARPQHVYTLMLRMNGELNQLLDFGFAPADVFQQITTSMSYASSILSSLPGVKSTYDADEFVANKTPLNVYDRLLKTQLTLQQAKTALGLKSISIKDSSHLKDPNPADVYDLATLVLSELVDLHQFMDIKRQPPKGYYPGKVIPSEVFQRVGILQQQINAIARNVSKLSQH